MCYSIHMDERMNELGVPEIDRAWLQAKIEALYDEIDDPCCDNSRVALEGDLEQERAYDDLRVEGCCGSVDVRFEGSPSSTVYLYGFNYGH
jgi:hypothetical protein